MTDSSKTQKLSFERLKFDQKIRKEWVFKFVFENGIFAKSAIFNLWIYADKERKLTPAGPSLGIIVGRKVHLRANVRNLWKRRMREVFRKHQAKIKPETAILLQARTRKEVPSYIEMAQDLDALMRKTGSLK